MEREGVTFWTSMEVGKDIHAHKIAEHYDAVVLAGGAEQPRDLPIPGREFKGIHFAMDFLTQQNKECLGEKIPEDVKISAKDKHVIVIGGGDTGSDCIGTSNRQGALSVTNFELLPQPPKERAADNPWPNWALIERTSTSHEEGVTKKFAVMTKGFTGENGVVKKLHGVELEFGDKDPETGRRPMKEVKGSEFEMEADLVLLAMGFLGPVKSGMLEELNVDLDERGNVKTNDNKMTSVPGVFAAGDMRRGQSLVVWAINEGRSAADSVEKYLTADNKA